MPSLSPLQAGLRTPSGQEGYTKENEITVLNFDKSKQVVCEICLEKHKKARHSDDDTCFYCSECGTLIRCMFYFLRQKNKVGSACKFSFVTRDSVDEVDFGPEFCVLLWHMTISLGIESLLQ